MRAARIQSNSRLSRSALGGGLGAALALLAGCSKSPDHQEQAPVAPPSLPAAVRSAAPLAALPPPRSGVLRPNDLLDAPASYLGHEVEVTIVESLSGPPTIEALAKAEYGQVRVDVIDDRGQDLALVPASFRAGDPDRYRSKFDRVIDGPVRVRGVFENDDELAKSAHRPAYVLRVTSIEPLALGAPLQLTRVAEIEANPAAWDRRLVVHEGVWSRGFEVSTLDDAVWLSTARGMTEIGSAPAPPRGGTKERVRATGFLFARPGASYGHLGAKRYQLIATRIEHLGAP
jgi:hypothetical protein